MSAPRIDMAREETGRRNRAKQDAERGAERTARAAEARAGIIFWRAVHKTAGCWYWSGDTRNGYGRVMWLGKREQAHRVAWLLSRGPIIEGRVLHTCGNRPCVRPDHLRLARSRP